MLTLISTDDTDLMRTKCVPGSGKEHSDFSINREGMKFLDEIRCFKIWF